MRLPAVAIAALFACGVVLGQPPWFAALVSSHIFLTIGACATTLICSSMFLTRSGHLFPAATVSVLSCIILGAFGAGIANQPWPAD